MKTAKLPKFDWGRVDEQNSGHTKDEWGLVQDENEINKIRRIEAYTIVWKT